MSGKSLNNKISLATKNKRWCADVSSAIDNGSTKRYKVDAVLPTEDVGKARSFEEVGVGYKSANREGNHKASAIIPKIEEDGRMFSPSSEQKKTENNVRPEERGTELVANADRIRRKIMIPVKRNPTFDYAGLIIGPRGSNVKALVREAGGNMGILVKGEGVSHGSKEPLHVLLEGQPSSVYRAELLINELLQMINRERAIVTSNGDARYLSLIGRIFEEAVKKHSRKTRKVFIPAEHLPGRRYVRLLIGAGGSRIKTLEAETCGKVNITVCDEKNCGKLHSGPPYVFLEGEPSFVEKAEILVNNMLKGNYIQWQRSERISRKIFMPVGRNPEIDYIGIFLASGASTINTLEADSGALVFLCGRGRTDGSDEPLHVLIEGDPSCVHKAEYLIHNLLRNAEQEKSTFKTAKHPIEEDLTNKNNKMHKLEDIVSRKIIIPPEFFPEGKYIDLLIGTQGLKHKALIAEAGGKARIVVHDRSEDCICDNHEGLPHVLIQGERQSVDKAESSIHKLFQLPRNNDRNDNLPLSESNKTNKHNNSRSLVDRVCALKNIVGVNFNSDETLSRKVILLEIETFGHARTGALTERISELEKVLG